ncbi:imidazole glycerol phosphate synthase subunit HisH [Vulcaniibacterium gelatinicum]|uniref:imidazole glycerol phosphate synthase subunit HisH n=1 Tax=Vulcaniibacterium gelatinicum TaxID=2598725 RepID=UPI0011CABBAB|nr:imidazole glycerol phosphate synthase subunit HisH [Vulcaniibacterium gelatinicum]
MSTVALIDAGGANLGSVRYALERLGVVPRIVRDADELGLPARVILPGVGAAPQAMRLLRERGLDVALRALEVPLLGICLGMQLLFERSEEGEVECLGLLPGKVRRLAPQPGLRVPHMGWNRLRPLRVDPLLDGIPADAHAYFVHGYAVPVTGDCLAASEHGTAFAAMVRRGRLCGAQFHPERSSDVGARLLRNFLALEAA